MIKMIRWFDSRFVSVGIGFGLALTGMCGTQVHAAAAAPITIALRYLEVVSTTLRPSTVALRADSLIVFGEYLGAHHPEESRFSSRRSGSKRGDQEPPRRLKSTNRLAKIGVSCDGIHAA